MRAAFGGNLGGITSGVLGAVPETARALRLDVIFPVRGLKRELSTTSGYELLVPDNWLADQTIARRRAVQLAQALDPPSLREASARRSTEPESAFGPPGSSGEMNIRRGAPHEAGSTTGRADVCSLLPAQRNRGGR